MKTTTRKGFLFFFISAFPVEWPEVQLPHNQQPRTNQ
jgi:hypothetical protein